VTWNGQPEVSHSYRLWTYITNSLLQAYSVHESFSFYAAINKVSTDYVNGCVPSLIEVNCLQMQSVRKYQKYGGLCPNLLCFMVWEKKD